MTSKQFFEDRSEAMERNFKQMAELVATTPTLLFMILGIIQKMLEFAIKFAFDKNGRKKKMLAFRLLWSREARTELWLLIEKVFRLFKKEKHELGLSGNLSLEKSDNSHLYEYSVDVTLRKRIVDSRYTGILEFKVIDPEEDENEGEILSLTSFGEYCPDNSLRRYDLNELINSPRYKVVKIAVKGKTVKVT